MPREEPIQIGIESSGNVQVIEINPNCKYAIIISEPLSDYQIAMIKEALGQWWQSDDPFILITDDIRIEQIGEKQ